jgi:hypothetical protein
VTPEGFGYDPQRGEVWFAGEAAEAVWLELEARRRALRRRSTSSSARCAPDSRGRVQRRRAIRSPSRSLA